MDLHERWLSRPLTLALLALAASVLVPAGVHTGPLALGWQYTSY